MLITFVLRACGQTEQTDVTEPSETVMAIRKPIPAPPAPLTGKKSEAPGENSLDKPPEPIGEQGIYRVRKSESLARISERAEVYGNPLKWTSLFRLNLEKFEGMKITPDFQDQELPEGLHLKFVTASQVQEGIKKLGKRVYVVNVLSEDTTRKITPHAITLIKNGYKAYICTAIIKDKEWIRLRAGFFRNRTEANEAGNQIASLLDGTSVWVVRISQTEIKDYYEAG